MIPENARRGYRSVAFIDLANEESLETNQDRWRSDDPFLALRARGAQRYVRSLSERTDAPAFRPRTRIGAAQFWADDEAAALALDSALRDRALLKAHPTLRDARLTVLTTREIPVVGTTEPRLLDGLRALFVVKRRPGMSVADYQDYWFNVHGQMVVGQPGLSRYVQNHRLAPTYEGAPDDYDGVAEMSWPDSDSMATSNAAEPFRTRQTDDLPNLFDLKAGIRFFVKEEDVF